MPTPIEDIRDQAEARFLGRDQVIGVGLVEDRAENLIILLQSDSVAARANITHWAREHGVDVEFLVTGANLSVG